MYSPGQHIRVLPRAKNAEEPFEGFIDSVNSKALIIKPDIRPHDGYRITIPWPDLKSGRYKIISNSSAHEESAGDGMILL